MTAVPGVCRRPDSGSAAARYSDADTDVFAGHEQTVAH